MEWRRQYADVERETMPQSDCVRRAYQVRFGAALVAAKAAQVGSSSTERKRIEQELSRLAREVAPAAPTGGASATRTVSPNGVADDLTALLRSRELILQPILDSIVADMDACLARLRLQPLGQTFAGLLPTGDFNARTASLGCGVLIVVNTGLMMLLHLVVKATSSAMRLSDVAPDGEIIPDAFVGPPTMTLDEVRSIATTAIVAYLLFGDAALSRRVAAQTGLRSELSSRILRACELFAVAHELGHQACGHLVAPGSQALALVPDGRTTVDSIEVVSRDWHQEFEADEMAVRIMLAHDEVAVVGMLFAMGPAIFFATDMLTARIRQRFLMHIAPALARDHPPSDQRWAAVRALMARSIGSDPLAVADICVSWILGLEEHVGAELRLSMVETT